MTTILAQDDPIIRSVQVILDPDTDPDRVAAVGDYYSVDLDDFEGWVADIRSRVPDLYPATVEMIDDQDGLLGGIAAADGIVIEDLLIGETELARAGRLAVVQKFGTDTRNIDLAACTRHGVAVATLRRRVNVAVAEHAFAMMLALAKKICRTNGLLDMDSLHAAGFPARMYDRRHVAAANWARVSGLQTLKGATLGALGLGEIGREVAARAHAFGMEVLYYQRNRLPAEIEEPLGAHYTNFEDLLARSDFLSIHLPINASTERMIDSAAIARMKPGATLVNISRAAIIDRDALIEGLESGRLGGAALDVHYKEPGDADDPLKRFDNVVLTPHIAVASRLNGVADIEELIGNLAAAIAGAG